MQDWRQILKQRYASEMVNVQFKAKNLFYVLFVVIATCVLMIAILIVMGRYSNTLTTGPAALVSVVCLIALISGKYYLVSSIYIFCMGLLPLAIMMLQTVNSYRDAFMFFVFATPVIVISTLVGYKRWQLWVLAAELYLTFAIYLVIRLLPALGEIKVDIVPGIIFACLFFGLAVVLLSITAQVEERIVQTIEKNFREAEERFRRMHSLIESSGKALSIGQDLSGLAQASVAAAADIENGTTGIVANIAELRAKLNHQADSQQKLDHSRLTVQDEMKRQSGAVSASSTAIEEMTASISQMSNSAQAKQELAKELDEQTIITEKAFAQTMNSFAKLDQSSAQVLEVSRVIQEIAERTNLLAMNAAIEAAHAGDSGKGFSVVASEIRKLAEETNANSRLISDIIRENDAAIKSAIHAGTENRQEFIVIRERTAAVRDALTEIIAGMSEVSMGTDEIVKTVQDLRDIQQQVTGSIDEMQAILQLSGQRFQAIEQSAAEIDQRTVEISQSTRDLKERNQKLMRIGQENEDTVRILQEGIDGLHRDRGLPEA